MNKKVLKALLVIVLVAYVGYCAAAQIEYSQGYAALKAKDWLTALIHFEQADGFKFAIPSYSSEIQELRDQASLLILGQSMRDKGNFKEALDAYETFVVIFPKAEPIKQVNEILPEVYLDWGKSLQEKSDFTGAIEKFEIINQKYAQTSYFKPAWEAEAETYQKWGDALAKSNDFASAVEKYEIVLQKFPTQSTEIIKESEAETYRLWGDALSKSNEYEKAVEKYEIVLTKFQNQSAAKNAQDNLDDVYLQWADQLRGNNQPRLALDKYEFIISKFKGSSTSTTAEAELVPTRLEWAVALHQNQEYEKEIEVLSGLIKNHKETPEAQQASQKIIPAYDSLGRQLAKNKSYIKSMQVYTEAKEFALDKGSQSVIDMGYKDATQGLAYDTKKDGEQAIAEAYTTACAGQPVKSPAVGILKDGPGKGMVCTFNFTMPVDLVPYMPAQFKYVIDVEYTTSDIQSCSYTGRGDPMVYKLIRQRNVTKVVVRNILTGKQINARNFSGPNPESCPSTRTFYSQTERILGALANEDDIAKWLKQVFK